jgi:hypothetical protein
MPFANKIRTSLAFQNCIQFFNSTFSSGEEDFKGNAFLAHFGTLSALCELVEAVVHKICRH